MEPSLPAPSDDDEYLTLADASARYHVGVSTLWGWLHRGLLIKYKKPLDRRVYVCVREIDALRNAKPTPVEKKEHE